MALYSLFHFKCTSPSSSLFLDFVLQFSEDTDSTLILNHTGFFMELGGRVDTNTSIWSSSWHNPELTSPPRGCPTSSLSHFWGCTDPCPPLPTCQTPHCSDHKTPYLVGPWPGLSDTRGPWRGPDTVKRPLFSCVTWAWMLHSPGLPWLRNKKNWIRQSGFFCFLFFQFPSSDFMILKVLLGNFQR